MFKRMIATLVVAFLVPVSLAACGSEASPTATVAGEGTPTPSAGGSTSSAGEQEITITAKDNVFDPTSYTVKAGQPIKLTIVNAGQQIHEVEVKDLLPETTLAPGQSKTVEIAAQQPGTHRIYCEIHGDTGMEGTFEIK